MSKPKKHSIYFTYKWSRIYQQNKVRIQINPIFSRIVGPPSRITTVNATFKELLIHLNCLTIVCVMLRLLLRLCQPLTCDEVYTHKGDIENSYVIPSTGRHLLRHRGISKEYYLIRAHCCALFTNCKYSPSRRMMTCGSKMTYQKKNTIGL